MIEYFNCYLTDTSSEAAKLEGVNERYLAPAIFMVVNGLLIYGLSDKIYIGLNLIA